MDIHWICKPKHEYTRWLVGLNMVIHYSGISTDILCVDLHSAMRGHVDPGHFLSQASSGRIIWSSSRSLRKQEKLTKMRGRAPSQWLLVLYTQDDGRQGPEGKHGCPVGCRQTQKVGWGTYASGMRKWGVNTHSGSRAVTGHINTK